MGIEPADQIDLCSTVPVQQAGSVFVPPLEPPFPRGLEQISIPIYALLEPDLVSSKRMAELTSTKLNAESHLLLVNLTSFRV